MTFLDFFKIVVFWLITSTAPSALAEDASSHLEAWLKIQLASGLEADFGQICKSQGDKTCRRIDASSLKDALHEKASDNDQQIIIKGATVVGKLDLSGLSISRRVSFVQCTFEDRASFIGTDFAEDLLIDGVAFLQGVDADNLHVGGQLFIRNRTIVKGGSFDLTNSYIKSDLSIAESDFDAPLLLNRSSIGTKLLIQTSTFRAGVSADFMDVAGSLDLGPDVTVSGGQASFRAASVGERLDFVNSHVLSSSNFVDMNIKGNVLFYRDVFEGDVDVSGSQILGDLRLKEEKDRGALVAQRLRVGGSLVIADNTHLYQMVDLSDSSISGDFVTVQTNIDMQFSGKRIRVSGSGNFDFDKIVGSVDLTDATIGVDLNLKNTTVACVDKNEDVDKGAFLAKGARVEGNIYIGPHLNETAGGINLVEVRVAGNIEVTKSTFSSKFLVPLAHVGQSIFIHETQFDSDILMNGSMIAQHLDLAGNTLGSIDLSQSNIGGDFRIAAAPGHTYSKPTHFYDAAVLNLRYARIGLIQDENERQPSGTLWPKKIDLQGLEYGSFGDARNIGWADSWLAKQQDVPEADRRGAIVQPYKSLATYFKNMGDDQTSDTLLVEAREKEKELYRSGCYPGHLMQGLNSCLGYAEMNLWGAIDYGVGSWQIKTLLYILCFVLFGAVVLYQSPHAREKGVGWRLGASLNRLIPVLDLRDEFKDFFEKPNDLKPSHNLYFYLHAIAGFVLASFVLAALTGLIQSK